MGHGDGGGIVARDLAQVSGDDGVFSSELVENAAVLRGVSRTGKTLNSVESFVLEPQHGHFKPMQTQRRTRIFICD